ncbi:hypothetical protein BBOR36S_03361 [Brevibacillus borstelensis]
MQPLFLFPLKTESKDMSQTAVAEKWMIDQRHSRMPFCLFLHFYIGKLVGGVTIMSFPFPPGSGGFPPGSSSQPPGSSAFPPGGFPPPPSVPPPSRIPSAPRSFGQQFRVDRGSFRGCLFRFTFVWLRNGRSFWFYPVFVSRTTVAGYRWNGFTWQYFGLALNRIVSFTCF